MLQSVLDLRVTPEVCQKQSKSDTGCCPCLINPWAEVSVWSAAVGVSEQLVWLFEKQDFCHAAKAVLSCRYLKSVLFVRQVTVFCFV